MKRIILETGSGADLHGMDYTKAAKRAVEDAIRHSSLSVFGSLKLNPKKMRIDLTIAAQDPEAVDLAEVAATLPYGAVHPKAVKGGLNCPDPATGADCVIVNAGILVSYPFD